MATSRLTHSTSFGPVEFARSISLLGPFESAPHIAVACSGGADSLALTLLADGWARAAGGRATALIVDHAMRSESAAEAASVRAGLADAGVDAVVLTRQGAAPRSDRQAAARRARYLLMTEWCRRAGILHLLLGHHRGDQAETLMLRLGRGSGVDGLAAMAPISENLHLRLLRPLLGIPREHLVSFLRSRGLDWVEDPSNDDTAFARVRLRRLLPELEEEGLSESRLAATARRMGRARMALESAATGLLARSAAIYPEGYALLSLGALLAAPEDTGLRALSRLLACIGGGQHGPRLEGLERLYDWLARGEGGGRTLAGCRIVRRGPGEVAVCREAAAAEGAVPATGGILWDGRFRLSADGSPDSRVGRLGPDGWARIVASTPGLRAEKLPADARNALPALWRLEEVVAVPHFHYRATPPDDKADDLTELTFLPRRTLGPACFSAVPGYA